MSNYAKVNMVQGFLAPKYPTAQELNLDNVNITEQGTEAKLPIVDFVMTGAHGEKYVLVLTGRIVNMISAAVKGANMRNHGIEEP